MRRRAFLRVGCACGAALLPGLARAQEGAGQQAAARNNYEAFLAIRGADAPADPPVEHPQAAIRPPLR